MRNLNIGVKNAKGSPLMYFSMMMPESVIATRSVLNGNDQVDFYFYEPTASDVALPRHQLYDKLINEGWSLAGPGVMFENIHEYASKRGVTSFSVQRVDHEWVPIGEGAILPSLYRVFTKAGVPDILEKLATLTRKPA